MLGSKDVDDIALVFVYFVPVTARTMPVFCVPKSLAYKAGARGCVYGES